MKKTAFNLILVAVCITFFSCQKDENLSTGSSSITNDGVISGKIVNYVPNSMDSVIAMFNGLTIFATGTGTVSTTGDFSMRLSVPQLIKVATLSGVTVSDTASIGRSAIIFSSFNSSLNGTLLKCNYANGDEYKAGRAHSMFVYTDRSFTMKGTNVDSSTSNGLVWNTTTTVYDVTFKKGWNEVVCKNISYSSTLEGETMSEAYSNNITSDLQWHYFKSDE
jgi:hypothetical protein